MNAISDKHVSNKSICIVSPHMDDAVLSMCDHITQWKSRGINVVVVTVFTSFGVGKLSDYSKRYLMRSGFHSVRLFEQQRRKEDVAAMTRLGVSWRHLGYVDGGFRKKENKQVYSTYSSLFSGNVSEWDKPVVKALRDVFSAFIKFQKIYLPLGIGGHADHHLVREAARGTLIANLIGYYVDYPYALSVKNWRFPYLFEILQNRISFKRMSNQKRQLISLYKTQTPLLFAVLPSYPEIMLG